MNDDLLESFLHLSFEIAEIVLDSTLAGES